MSLGDPVSTRTCIPLSLIRVIAPIVSRTLSFRFRTLPDCSTETLTLLRGAEVVDHILAHGFSGFIEAAVVSGTFLDVATVVVVGSVVVVL